MIKNLNQLKKALQPGTQFKIVGHCRPECIGQLREVKAANTVGFYSVIPGAGDNKVNNANGGKGSFLGWSKAPFWVFSDDVCALYSSDQNRGAEHLILSFRMAA